MNNKYWLSNNAYDLDLLRSLDIIINCHGSSYTNKIYYKLRSTKWNGYWLDTSSLLRMKNDTVIVLDPINLPLILHNLNNGIKNFVSGNCTVNLLLMSLGGLFINNLIDWISVATYQAVSGGGARYMLKLINQLKLLNIISNSSKLTINNLTTIEYSIRKNILCHHQPLAYNIIPWIGNKKIKEQSLEEWKSQIEINKIINTICSPIKIDGTCVRVNTLRCHSQALTVKLKKNLTVNDITQIIVNHNKWIKFIPNTKESSINQLNPLIISNTLDIAVGRLRKLNIGKKYLTLFTIGDQLLWGAAEPIRRMLRLLINN